MPNRFKLHATRTGVTLVEVLVVLGVIVLLMIIAFPAIQQLREASRRTQCLNQVRQLVLATLNYESARQSLPQGVKLPGGLPATTSDELLAWSAELSPFLEGPDFDRHVGIRSLTQVFTDGGEAQLKEQLTSNAGGWFRCPADANAPALNDRRACSEVTGILATTNYVAANNVGPCQALRNPLTRKAPNGAFHAIEAETLDAFTDGTSHTILFSERIYGAFDATGDPAAAALAYVCRGLGNAVDYRRPGIQDLTFGCAGGINRFDSSPFPEIAQHGVSSGHVGGIVVGSADGATHFMAADVESWYRPLTSLDRPPSPEEYGVWERLVALEDGQVVALPE